MTVRLARGRNLLGRFKASLEDGLDLALGRRQEMVPPRWLGRLTGARGEFVAVGEELARLVIDEAGLAPDERLLDVGCGSGRLAVPLTRHLTPKGSYDGVDVMAPAIRWCRRRITPHHPHFCFHHLDVRNGVYNPGGKLAASEAVFPFADGAFDLAVLTSVFTHMKGSGFDRYLEEMARLVRPGGRLLATYFLLNVESEKLIRAGRTRRSFPHDFGTYRAEEATAPESIIAFRENHMRRQYEKVGFRIREPIRYGKWCGRSDHVSFQDLVVAERAATPPERKLAAP